MDLDDLILVSVDDHVVEPPDLFDGRLSAAAAERAPRVEVQPGGREAWVFEGAPLPNVGLNAVAGRVPEEYGVDPLAFREMRPQVAGSLGSRSAAGRRVRVVVLPPAAAGSASFSPVIGST